MGFQSLVAGLPRGLLWAEQGGSPAGLAKSQKSASANYLAEQLAGGSKTSCHVEEGEGGAA